MTLVATAMFGAIAPAHADNWGSNAANAAKTAAQNYLNAKYSSELQGHNVQLKKSEFGPFPVAHLGIDVLVDGFLGGTLVYNPATQEVKLYGSWGNFSEAQSAKQYAADSSCFGTYGMEVSIGGVPTYSWFVDRHRFDVSRAVSDRNHCGERLHLHLDA